MRAVARIAAAFVLCSAARAAEPVARDLHEEVVRTDVTLTDCDGRTETKAMPVTIFRPDGDGPFPLAVFSHGRAVDAKRAEQGRSRPEALARFLVAKGFVVLAPTRIGYWETYGGFDPEGVRGCRDGIAHEAEVASDEALAAVAYAKTLAYVDATRWVALGQSVGGLATVALVGRHPDGLAGGVNFAGGSGGNPDTRPGKPRAPERVERVYAQAAATSTAPMLWMYWSNDLFWGGEWPRRWYDAWAGAGGRGTFDGFGPAGDNGHGGINLDMGDWVPALDRFLVELGFTRDATPMRPPASTFATLTEADRLPVRSSSARDAYAKFLAAAGPRAFAVGDRGAFGWATKDYAIGRALGLCARSGQACRLYAVDDDVVWTAR